MAKIPYMVTESYVENWRLPQALREIISNAVDAEKEFSAPLNVVHNPRTETLIVKNDRAKLDVKALYFGGTSKAGNTAMVGQYGEGLKLALLVFARSNISVKVHNDDEVWTPKIEPDGNGVRVLTLYTRKAEATGAVEVEIKGITFDMWDTVRTMFLRLLPAMKTVQTEYGTILFDTERVGKYYARGVWICDQQGSSFGYDFKHLNVGRDRASFNHNDAAIAITNMWTEAVTREDEVIEPLFLALKSDAQDLSGFDWMSRPSLSEKLVKHFKALYGETAYPVTGTAELAPLDHLGLIGVVLPKTLVSCLRRAMPAVETIQRELARQVKQRYGMEDLSGAERGALLGSLDLLKRVGIEAKARVVVVQFGDPKIAGLHLGEEIQIAKLVLANPGETLVTLAHELAHDVGADGTRGHVSRHEEIMIRVLNLLLPAPPASEEGAPPSPEAPPGS